MPAAVAIPLVTTAVSAGASIFQSTQAAAQAKKAQDNINNYQRQQLVNPYDGLQVSTLGADRQREDLARTMSTYANSAAMGGSRSILGLAPQLIAQQNSQDAQINAGLDQQYNQNQQLVAQGNGMLQQERTQLENNDLLGLGNQLNVARQEQGNGLNNLIQTGISAGNLAGNMAANGMFKSTPQTVGQQMMNNQDIYHQNGVGSNMKLLQPQIFYSPQIGNTGINTQLSPMTPSFIPYNLPR